MDWAELFWGASLEELKRGVAGQAEEYVCLLCGKRFEKGRIYEIGGGLYEAEKSAQLHVVQQHGSVFEHLLGLDRRLTGLTEHQAALLRLFYQGYSDKEIQKELGIGSISTIRNHRFALREKERQAKLLLVLMELLEEKSSSPALVNPPPAARMVDRRWDITLEENEQILGKFFPQGPSGPLAVFPRREKQKVVVLRELAGRFRPGRSYTEKEVNAVLSEAYERDHVTLRRYLIEYGFLERRPDGSEYWVKNGRGEE